MNKETDMTMKVNPYFKDTLETSNVVWSHDENSYQFNFDFTDFLCKKPVELMNSHPRILLEFLNDDCSDKQIYPLIIDSERLGQAHFIIPDKILGYVGDVKASLTIDFDDKSHDLGSFYFRMKKSPIDDKMPELQFWVDEFDQAFKLFKHGLDEFNEDIKESNAKVDEIKDLIVKNDVLKKVEAGPFEDFREWDNTIISKMKNEFTERGVNVKWFKNSEGDFLNGESIQKAIDYAYSNNINKVVCPSGTYIIDKPVALHSSSIQLVGVWNKTIFEKKSNTIQNNKISTYIGKDGIEQTYSYSEPSIINVFFPYNSYATYIDIRNITFKGNGVQRAIDMPRIAHSNFENIVIHNCKSGIYTEVSWMNTYNNIRSVNCLNHVEIKSGTSNKISRWHCDGGPSNAVGFRISDLVYSNFDNCGTDRVSIGYLFRGKSDVSLTGCGSEVWSRTLQVEDESVVTLTGCYLEVHATAEGQKAIPWIFTGDSKVTFIGGALTFKNYNKIKDISSFSVPLLQKNANVRFHGTKLDFRDIVKSSLFIVSDNAIVNIDDEMTISKNLSKLNSLKKSLSFNANDKTEIFRIKNIAYNDAFSVGFTINGVVQRTAKTFGYSLSLSKQLSITNAGSIKYTCNGNESIGYFAGDYNVKITTEISVDIVDSDCVIYLQNIAESTNKNIPEIFKGTLEVKGFGINGSTIKCELQ